LVTSFLLTVGVASSQSRSKPDLTLEVLVGKIEVEGGVATIDLPDGWGYLHQREARHVVEEVWGFPAEPNMLGLVLPPEKTSWGGFVVLYAKLGYLDDSEVDLNPSVLAEQMRGKEFVDNTNRIKHSLSTIELVGWTDPPHYDPTTKKLRWGRSLRRDGRPTLAYDMRLLGAEGILAMVAIIHSGDAASVAAGARRVLAGTEFTAALSYSMHDPSVHRVYRTTVADLIRGNPPVRHIELFRILLRPVIALAVLLIALFAARRLRRRSPITRKIPPLAEPALEE